MLLICYIYIYFSIDLPDFMLLFFAESEPENGGAWHTSESKHRCKYFFLNWKNVQFVL